MKKAGNIPSLPEKESLSSPEEVILTCKLLAEGKTTNQSEDTSVFPLIKNS